LHNPMKIALSVLHEVRQVRLDENVDGQTLTRLDRHGELERLDNLAASPIGAEDILCSHSILTFRDTVPQTYSVEAVCILGEV